MPDDGSTKMHRASLGLGGNVGDPQASMAAALGLLNAMTEIDILTVSRIYRTPPWGKVDQDWFYNCCALVRTSLTPRQLLEACLAVESKLKRVRRERWGPRIIDVDVLTYDCAIVDEDGLAIPHPHMHERAFVLLPLNEIDGTIMVREKPVSQWASDVDGTGIEPASKDGSWWLG